MQSSNTPPSDSIPQLDERARALVDDVKERVAPVDAWLRAMASERPLLTLAGALGIGYLAGRLIRRL